MTNEEWSAQFGATQKTVAWGDGSAWPSSSETLVQRLARSLVFELEAQSATGAGTPEQAVRALLWEMQTPTQDMLEAGEAWNAHCGDVDSLWSEMIRAALEE